MKVILVSNTAGLLRSFCLPLLLALRNHGADVVVAAPRDADAEALIAEGFRFAAVPFTRGMAGPGPEMKAFRALLGLYRRERPDVVHHFTAKPIVLGSVAARLGHVPNRIATLPGLGYVFAKPGRFARLLQWAILRLYRAVLHARSSWVICLNPDDRELLLRRDVVSADRSAVVLSFGTDTRAFPLVPLPGGVPVVLCAARLLWDKGIGEFVEAARRLREQNIAARFLLAGWLDSDHPMAIPEDTIRRWHDAGTVEYIGHSSDMPGLLAQCSIVVLPSRYREGVPQILIEAASMGRPVIASDVPGCREVCVNERTGLLINPGDPDALANAIRRLLADPAGAAEMGRHGRRLAEDVFDISRAVAGTLGVYASAWPDASLATVVPQRGVRA